MAHGATAGVVPPTGMWLQNAGLDAVAVTASDTTVVGPTRYVYVGDSTAHSLVVVMWNDNTNTAVTFANVPAGAMLPINVRHVMAATTCTNVVAIA